MVRRQPSHGPARCGAPGSRASARNLAAAATQMACQMQGLAWRCAGLPGASSPSPDTCRTKNAHAPAPLQRRPCKWPLTERQHAPLHTTWCEGGRSLRSLCPIPPAQHHHAVPSPPPARARACAPAICCAMRLALVRSRRCAHGEQPAPPPPPQGAKDAPDVECHGGSACQGADECEEYSCRICVSGWQAHVTSMPLARPRVGPCFRTWPSHRRWAGV